MLKHCVDLVWHGEIAKAGNRRGRRLVHRQCANGRIYGHNNLIDANLNVVGEMAP